MPLPWIKMWLEALDDPKLTRLSLAEKGAWWGILKLAGKCDAGGKLLSGGQGLDTDEIADALHIKTSEDRQSLETMIGKMKIRGSLKWNENNTLTVIHWEERQRIPPSARPEAIADRVRRYRERRKKTEEPEELAPPPTLGTSKEATPEMSQDDEVLAIWSGAKNFPLITSEDSKEATRFLTELKAEFPDVDILEESKSWAAAKLSEPLTKRSMPFKQLRTWMKRAREYRQKPYREKKPKEKGAAPKELLED
ncbi:hypothetical protein ES707_03630 [subsurface metagenome]